MVVVGKTSTRRPGVNSAEYCRVKRGLPILCTVLDYHLIVQLVVYALTLRNKTVPMSLQLICHLPPDFYIVLHCGYGASKAIPHGVKIDENPQEIQRIFIIRPPIHSVANEKIVLPQERLALVFWSEGGQCQLMMGQELFPALCNSTTSTRATNHLQFSASMGGKVQCAVDCKTCSSEFSSLCKVFRVNCALGSVHESCRGY